MEEGEEKENEKIRQRDRKTEKLKKRQALKVEAAQDGVGLTLAGAEPQSQTQNLEREACGLIARTEHF